MRCEIGWPTSTVNARNTRELLPDFFHHFGVRASAFFGDDFEFAGVDAGGVLIEFGAAGAARGRDDLGSFVQCDFDQVDRCGSTP